MPSEERVNGAELVRRLRAGFSDEGGFEGLDGQAMADAFVATIEPYADETFTCHMLGAGDAVWEGLEGLRAGWRDFLEGFDFLRIVPGELRESDAGDVVVDFVRMECRPRGTQAQLDQPAAAVWRFQDGRLTAVEFHIDRDAALRSAGLA
jgi:ketosteroid isomerase-like protein